MTRDAVTAFLPAALEIQHAPPSPLGRALIWVILALFVAAVCWATVGRIDVVAVARGRIITEGHSKTVQPLGIGTIVAIHVSEGQAVAAGDLLVELDDTAAMADIERLGKERDQADREVARVGKLLRWLEAGFAQRERELAETADPLLRRQWLELEDGLAVLDHQRDGQRAERQSVRRQVDKLEALLPIVTQRAADQRDLADRKLLPEQQYLASEQERLEIHHDLLGLKDRVEELDRSMQTLAARIVLLRSEFHRRLLERLEDAERRRSFTDQELVKALTRARSTRLLAPVDGTVQQLAVRNVGAIVTPAQELMLIVPRNEQLEVEAVLENKDVGFVTPGQRVEIKVDAFPFTRYGTIPGRVTRLSGDAVTDERNRLVYAMRVRLEKMSMRVNGDVVRLSPGMSVTAEAITGSRRVIEYFLSPLLRYRDESIRER